jgi:hypothetical protein
MENPICDLQAKLLSIHKQFIDKGYIPERMSAQARKGHYEVSVRLFCNNQYTPLFHGFAPDTKEFDCVIRAEIAALIFAAQATANVVKIELDETPKPDLNVREIYREDIIGRMGNTVEDVLRELKRLGVDLEDVHREKRRLNKTGGRLTKDVVADILLAKTKHIVIGEKKEAPKTEAKLTFKLED